MESLWYLKGVILLLYLMGVPYTHYVRCNVEIMVGYLNPGVTSMQVFYYGNTGFGTKDLLCKLSTRALNRMSSTTNYVCE